MGQLHKECEKGNFEGVKSLVTASNVGSVDKVGWLAAMISGRSLRAAR